MPNVNGWYSNRELDQIERDWVNGDPIDLAAALRFLREARACREGECIDERTYY